MADEESGAWEDALMADFRAMQEPVIEAWVTVLNYHVGENRGAGDQAYNRAAEGLTQFLRERGMATDDRGVEHEIRLCQIVGCLRAAERWQNPPRSDAPDIPAWLRRKKPLVFTDEMLWAP